MKIVILAGGLGTRISEESLIKPKPLTEIGSKPIIWHIMKIYSSFGFKEFIICCGYKGYLIKEYFANYLLHTSDITVDLKANKIIKRKKNTEDWKVTMVDTGEHSQTGERIRRIKDYLNKGETFCLTYGDGLSSINIKKLIKSHQSSKKIASVLAVKPEGRWGSLGINSDNNVVNFLEKPKGDNNWVNGGFFILNYKIFEYIKGPNPIWEREPMEMLSKNNQLHAYKFEGFWHAMDTLRDKNYLDDLWKNKKAPWKLWDE
jgi:glucose-1-phosphate cytidylyltransferase